MNVHAVIPCFKVSKHILDVLERIGPEVHKIWVVDDACPEATGELVMRKNSDRRVEVIFHSENSGVGAATISGYLAAANEGADIVVKIDGDGQMHPEDVQMLLNPIISGDADYTKGNRFEKIRELLKMPKHRIFGNGILSLISKISSGYWSINDPTNGFTAIHKNVLNDIELEKLAKRYFFESDMLFRLNLAGAVVKDVPLPARYGNEVSNLRVRQILIEFCIKHTKNAIKRIIYKYYLREWSIGTVEMFWGLTLMSVGGIFGLVSVLNAMSSGTFVSAGQITFSSLVVILGFQLLLSFINFDIQMEPKFPKSRILSVKRAIQD